LALIERVLEQTNDRKKELKVLDDTQRKFKTVLAGMRCECEGCPDDVRSMQTSAAVILNNLDKLPNSEVVCEWIEELTHMEINFASILSRDDSLVIDPKAGAIKSCLVHVAANAKVRKVRDCKKSQDAMTKLVSKLRGYLEAYKLKKKILALAELLPQEIVVQLLLASGYLCGFVYMVQIAQQITMGRKATELTMGLTCGTLAAIVLLVIVIIFKFVGKLVKEMDAVEVSKHIVTARDSPDAACGSGQYMKAPNPEALIECEACPTGYWSPRLVTSKPASECFECVDVKSCQNQEGHSNYDEKQVAACKADAKVAPCKKDEK